MIPDPNARRVLLFRCANGWTLPSWETDPEALWHLVAPVNQAARRLVGFDVTTLRRLRAEGENRFYELESHAPERAPSDGAWFDRDEIEGVELAEPAHREVLARCLDERGDDCGDLCIAWTRPGWLATAVAWIGKRLSELGLEPGPIVQERTWSISTLLRAPTGEGDFYFKASAPVFASEPPLIRELARSHPGRTPEVVAVELERRWTLMRDFGGTALDVERDPAAICDALRIYARMQLDWVEGRDDLLALGCSDRTLAALEREIDRCLGDEGALLAGGRLSEPELREVPELAERLRKACAGLRRFDLPPTLEHGDLHTDNIRSRDDGFLFYDWSDGCISVPFFSLVPLLQFESLPDARTGRLLRDAYLEPWAAEIPRSRLVPAFELAQYVGLFHQAVSYYRIVEYTEPRARWEWERVFPELVKRLLARAAP